MLQIQELKVGIFMCMGKDPVLGRGELVGITIGGQSAHREQLLGIPNPRTVMPISTDAPPLLGIMWSLYSFITYSAGKVPSPIIHALAKIACAKISWDAVKQA